MVGSEMGHHGVSWLVTSNNLMIVDCRGCGYVHLFPVPNGTEKYYEDDHFYREYSPLDWLTKDVLEYRLGWMDAAYEHQIRLLDSNLPIIDVGAGTGTFVHYAWYRAGIEAHGIEPSKMATDVSPVRTLMHKSLDQLLERNPHLTETDCNVRMALVLEHIPDPYAFLQQYRSLLGKSGRLMIVVPNEMNPLQQRAGGYWWVSKVHANYFTPDSLRNILDNLGIEVIHAGTTFPMELAIALGYDYRGNDRRGRNVHRLRLRLEKTFGPRMFDLYKRLYDKYGWGRELIMVGKNA